MSQAIDGLYCVCGGGLRRTKSKEVKGHDFWYCRECVRNESVPPEKSPGWIAHKKNVTVGLGVPSSSSKVKM